jgi:4-amino-4-deoxy-L-arabinose transferase-like glycosyltransferase
MNNAIQNEVSSEGVKPVLFAGSRWLLLAAVIFLFALGLTIRLYDLTDLPLDFHSTRQMHSALMARGMFYENLTGIPDWQRQMAVQQWQAEGLIEPPIMERLTAFTYGLIGQDLLWVARLYSIFFWLIGALALFFLAKNLIGPNGAVVALGFFLVLPYGALASRAFQPDPLMVSAIILSWWAADRWRRKPNWKNAVIAGLLAGFAIFVKSVAVFFVAGGLIGLILAGMGLKAVWKSKQVWLMAVLTILPYGIFHIYGVYITGLLQDQFSLRFFPQLWIDPVFYLRWNGEISSVVDFELFLAGLIGIFLVKDKPGRWLLIGAWIGYLLFSLTLPYHAMTHDYYQLPIIPLVGLGLAAVIDRLLRSLQGPRLLASLAVLGVLLFWVAIKAWDVRVTLKRMDYRGEPAIWQGLGETLGHDSKVLALTQDYGYRLGYWGWITPTNWMYGGDFTVREMSGQQFDVETLFFEQTEGKDYFLVTQFDEFNAQAELKKMMYDTFPVLQDTDDYLIFDLKHPLPADGKSSAQPQ